MKISKLNMVRMVSLTILTAVAVAALYAPAAVNAGSGKDFAPGQLKKSKQPKHRELVLDMTCDGPCVKSKGYAGEKYCIEATTDLAHPDWQPICAEVTTTDGHIEYTDTCASNYPARFYRVCWSSVKTNNGNHYGTLKHAD